MWLLLIVGKFYQKVVNKYFFNMSYEPGMCLATWNISINKQKKKNPDLIEFIFHWEETEKNVHHKEENYILQGKSAI